MNFSIYICCKWVTRMQACNGTTDTKTDRKNIPPDAMQAARKWRPLKRPEYASSSASNRALIGVEGCYHFTHERTYSTESYIYGKTSHFILPTKGRHRPNRTNLAAGSIDAEAPKTSSWLGRKQFIHNKPHERGRERERGRENKKKNKTQLWGTFPLRFFSVVE